MTRVGIGFDVHAFDEKSDLVLGGVTFQGSPGLAGHSDGDVLCHAVGDAVLGAAALGDLGDWFPETDEWRDSSSIDLLRIVAEKLGERGWRVVNVDATVLAQSPKLKRHKESIIERIADALSIESGFVSVKATTTDGLGSIGRVEGIAAMAVATVERSAT